MAQSQHPTLAERRAMTKEIDVRMAQRAALPDHPLGEEWHPLTVRWWDEVWESGLTAQWTIADVQSAYRLAALDDAFWKCKDGASKAKINSAIIAASRPLGLDPASRRAMKWVPRPIEAPRAATSQQKQARDPRLTVVDSPRKQRRATG